jgi:hypothetical protein
VSNYDNHSVVIEPATIGDVARTLPLELPKVDVFDVEVRSLDPTKIRIETPLQRLTDYHFASNAGRCSWTTLKGTITVRLGAFEVEQRAENELFCIYLSKGSPTQSLLFDLLQGPHTGVRDIFITRSLRAVEGLKLLDEENLIEAVKAPTDYSVLVSALNTEQALAAVRDTDPLAGARLRGMDAKRRLLESEGGAISSVQAADILKVTRQAIDKRRKEGKLLALELGKRGYCYPSWQLGLEGFEQVLAALKGRDFWEQLSFFLNPSALLEDRTPLQVLRDGKNLKEAIKAARSYGEHGG